MDRNDIIRRRHKGISEDHNLRNAILYGGNIFPYLYFNEEVHADEFNRWHYALDKAIQDFPELDKDLEGYAGFDSEETIESTRSFLDKLYRHQIKSPNISPFEDDSINMEWYFSNDIEVIVTACPQGKFNCCYWDSESDENCMEYESITENDCVKHVSDWFSSIIHKQLN